MSGQRSLITICAKIRETYRQLGEAQRDFDSQPPAPHGSAERNEQLDLSTRFSGREMGLNDALRRLDPRSYNTQGPWRKQAYEQVLRGLTALTTYPSREDTETRRTIRNGMIRGVTESFTAVSAAINGDFRPLERLPQPHLEDPPRQQRRRDRGRGIE